jgi:periplasmic protein TonB
MVVFAALLLMKQIQLTPEEVPFKLNIAMVAPAPSVQQMALPSSQTPVSAVPSTTLIPSPTVQQFARTQVRPSHQSKAQQTMPPAFERTVSPAIEPVEPIPRQSEATSIAKPADAPPTVSAESDAQTAPSSTPPATLEQSAPSDQAPAPTQMAAVFPAPTNASLKLDYGWLSETILRRVEELKRYPASARMDRAEGKVVVKAVIHEGGSIGNVEVFQSSGHPGLDKAAIETLRQAAPFPLSRPLGQPHMTIKIPMSYRLDR